MFGKPGVLHDPAMLASIGTSLKVAVPVAVLAVALGTANAFLLERAQFRGKTVLAMMMLWPLVIPGVILGISILAFFSRVANGLEDWLQMDLDFLRPGPGAGGARPVLVHPHHLDADHRRAAAALRSVARGGGLRSGRRPRRVLRTVTLPYLRPALIGAGLVALLMSFENFNTTLMLVGSDPPLPINMYGQMREGATPAINAVSLLVMLAVGGIASLFALIVRPR